MHTLWYCDFVPWHCAIRLNAFLGKVFGEEKKPNSLYKSELFWINLLSLVAFYSLTLAILSCACLYFAGHPSILSLCLSYGFAIFLIFVFRFQFVEHRIHWDFPLYLFFRFIYLHARFPILFQSLSHLL